MNGRTAFMKKNGVLISKKPSTVLAMPSSISVNIHIRLLSQTTESFLFRVIRWPSLLEEKIQEIQDAALRFHTWNLFAGIWCMYFHQDFKKSATMVFLTIVANKKILKLYLHVRGIKNLNRCTRTFQWMNYWNSYGMLTFTSALNVVAATWNMQEGLMPCAIKKWNQIFF